MTDTTLSEIEVRVGGDLEYPCGCHWGFSTKWPLGYPLSLCPDHFWKNGC